MIGELEAAVAAHPFQESLWVLLITALYRDGRQADALAAYQRVRDRLADELGLDPGPQLQQLERQILIHDASLDAAGHATIPIEGHDAVGNLPSLSVELVGRDTRARCPVRPARHAAARRGRRARRRRQDGARDRCGAHLDDVGWYMVGETRNGDHAERRHRHGDRRVGRRRR